MTRSFYSSVPKGRRENVAFRRKVLRAAAKDEKYRAVLMEACRRDCLFFINVFGWLFEPRDKAIVPAITYPVQDEYVNCLVECIGKKDVAVPKVRDQGATWFCLYVLMWLWLFHKNATFLLLNRKEELVDSRGDHNALFTKLDFILEHLPAWMRPVIREGTERKSMYLRNPLTGSVFTGESTNQFAGVGGRVLAIVLEEFSLMPDQDSIYQRTQFTTNTRIFIFTANSSRNRAAKLARMEENERFRRFDKLKWQNNPVHSRGMYTAINGRLELLDREFDWQKEYPEGYPYVLDGLERSPYADAELRRGDPRQVSAELYMNFNAADPQYFGPDLMRTLEASVRDPLETCDLACDSYGNPISVEASAVGRLKLWVPREANGGLAVNGPLFVGVDIATGTGGSNSAVCVYDAQTRAKVAEYCNPHIFASDFCLWCVALCRWLENTAPVTMIWEIDGPGAAFGLQAMDLGCGSLWFRRQDDRVDRPMSLRPGFKSTRDTKRRAFEDYSRAIRDGLFIERSRQACGEHANFIYMNDEVLYADAYFSADTSGAGANHGDVVIANVLAWHAARDIVVPRGMRDAPENVDDVFEAAAKKYREEQRRRMADDPWLEDIRIVTG